MVAQARRARHWIDGEWVGSDQQRDSFNPATGELIGSYADAGEAEAKRAIAVARRVFLESGWRDDRRLRAKVLNEMADRFEAATPTPALPWTCGLPYVSSSQPFSAASRRSPYVVS